jgi:hypothetical protein
MTTMPKKAKGWLRRKTYAEGDVFLFCYDVPRPGMRPAENSQLIGLVSDFPTEDDAWREVQLKGYWKLVEPSLSISPTFGELAQHFRLEELKRNGPLSKRATETITTHESMLDGYVLPKWSSTRALDMTVPMVETWFEELAATANGRAYAEGKEPPKGYVPSLSSGRRSRRSAAPCRSSSRMRCGIVFCKADQRSIPFAAPNLRAAFAASQSPITTPPLSRPNR